MSGASAECVVFGMNSTCVIRNSPSSNLASRGTPSYRTMSHETKSDIGSIPNNSKSSKKKHRCFGTFIMTCSRIRDWLLNNLRHLNLPWNKSKSKENKSCTPVSQRPPTPYWEDPQDIGTQVLTATMREITQTEREDLQRPEIHTLNDVLIDELQIVCPTLYESIERGHADGRDMVFLTRSDLDMVCDDDSSSTGSEDEYKIFYWCSHCEMAYNPKHTPCQCDHFISV